MNKKYLIVSSIISVVIVIIYILNVIYNEDYETAKEAYLVYLDGQEIGLIEDSSELYSLINNEQQTIKDEYDVDYVYPPSGLEVVSTSTFKDDYISVEDVYKSIESNDNFTVKGYIVTIKSEDSEDIVINVLDKSIFENALRSFVLTFITEEELENYNNGNRTISDIGSIINEMGIDETITIKEGYISVDEKIYTTEEELSKYLLFGSDAEMNTYVVKEGDTIESISEEQHINSQEFLVANPEYSSEDALLTVGSSVNITLIDPVLTLTYTLYKITEQETPYSIDTVVDSTKSSDYSEITRSGVSGLSLIHATYQVVNGVQAIEANILETTVIREMVNQEVTVGRKKTTQSISGSYVSVSGWGYPTNYPYMVTSAYGWRSYKMHYGLDISGTGFRSPIYAVADGTVVEVSYRSTDGNFVIIQHDNNLYTQYAHMYQALVTEGQTVSKGTQIGEMGESGLAYGVHLHFGVSIGWPYHGSYSFQNPNYYIKF